MTPTAQIARRARPASGTLTPPVVFLGAAAVGALVLAAISAALFGAAAAGAIGGVVLAYLAASAGVAIAIARIYPHDRLGLCNLVTQARMAVIGVFAVAVLTRAEPSLMLVALALASLALDGVDGWLARRQGLASEFGARFDVEVDAAFALALAATAVSSGDTGATVLLLGLPHYGFWIARRRFDWLNAPLPRSLMRKTICVAQIAVLIALLVPQLAGPLRDGAVIAVVAALAWSFGRDILWLYRHRG